MYFTRQFPLFTLILGALFASPTLWAQQTGTIEGTVWQDGSPLANMRVEASSPSLPRPRTALSDANGRFSLPQLIPGSYELRALDFEAPHPPLGAEVLLNQVTSVSFELKSSGIEEIRVVAARPDLGGGTALNNVFGTDVLLKLPIAVGYRDLTKFIPGIQYSEDLIRGPNAGGNGQDNTYQFDGADLSLPLFGTLSAEPSNHDIEQVAFERGGADAVGFNRSGGFAMDSKARSGSDQFSARIEYRLLPATLVKDPRRGEQYDTHRAWTTFSASGPLLPQQLFFYSSFFSPEAYRDNKTTAYGPTKDYQSRRNEYFGKLTYAPSNVVLFNASYRTSTRKDQGVSVGPYEADSVSVGERSEQDILTLDGSWQMDSDTTLAAKFYDYQLRGFELPDVRLDVQPRLGSTLDVHNLDQMGYLQVPQSRPGEDRFNANIRPLIQAYGYVDESGMRVGGGAVGAHPRISEGSYFRLGAEISLDRQLTWGNFHHLVHFGIRWNEGRESLRRTSNGWGTIRVPGGVDVATDGRPIFFVAQVEQMSLMLGDRLLAGPIDSSIETYDLELNDRIERGAFTYNLGLLVSQDILYGQGLKEEHGTYSGYALAPGNKYKMYTINWRDMIQPRLGIDWNYHGHNRAYLSFARYHPQASSLARAASWDRNTRASLELLIDEQGRVISHAPQSGSSGKVFASGLQPRRIDEWLIGTLREIRPGLQVRAHLRHRKARNMWEDTWNLARAVYDSAPAEVAAKGAYVPDLDSIRAEIGGSSYVIAELDGAYTEYWEAVVELEWHGERSYLNASYSRSRYRGNFDQDNTSGVNDANRFIGSSNLADGYGRQLWDNKDGVLRGDRPHVFKAFGYYNLSRRSTIGAFLVFSSGQPWEAWDASAYGLASYVSDVNRYAERAGSRRSPSHWQIDLSFQQEFSLITFARASIRLDVFNLFDNQSGYNYNPFVDDAGFGEPRSYFNSRRVQVSLSAEV